MKKLFTLILLGAALGANAQNVGINTTDPKATLQVVGAPASAGVPDGIIPPKLTRAQLIAKTGYGTDQIGAIVYVTDLSGTTNAATASVLQIGHYSFDGTKWNNMLMPKFTGFFATKNNDLILTSGASVEVIFNGELYDVNDWYNPANGRFTPKVAGYYQFNASIRMFRDPYLTGERSMRFVKTTTTGPIDMANGSAIIGNTITSQGSTIIYLNGTTDYVSIKVYSADGFTSSSNVSQSYFQGYLVGQ